MRASPCVGIAMQIGNNIIQEYYVIFTDSKRDNWMVKRLKAPFQHVYAIKKSEGGHFWVKVDPTSPATLIDLYPVHQYPDYRLLIKDSDKVIRVTAKIDPDRERWTLCIFNCVEQVKALLGIRSFWTWTPRQLYRYLRRA